MTGWSREEMAAQVAADIPPGAVVNLGIGQPTLVAGFVAPDSDVVFHSENGILGMGPRPDPGAEDLDIIDAGKTPVTLLPGAAIVHHADSFAVIRGGRLDIAVLGAYQVSSQGDLASWIVAGQELGSIGGAMDIALGAKRVFVMMQHCDKEGRPKIVGDCTYPLTAPACVSRIYTDLAVIDVRDGLFVRRMHPLIGFEELQAVSGAHLGAMEAAAS